MDIASARISKGITNAITAVTPPVIRVPITGISVLFAVHWKKGNSKPCRGNMAWRERLIVSQTKLVSVPDSPPNRRVVHAAYN